MNIFASIDEAVNDIIAGKMLIVVDDENRENEGDLIMAAQHITAADVNFMITHARGLLCAPASSEILERLNINIMTDKITEKHGTKFTVSIDARADTTTGISASERAQTLRLMATKTSSEHDFVRPGHIFPLIAEKGGVLKRAGHTEAAVDLCKLAGLEQVGAICEIINEDGEMARLEDLIPYGKKHDIKIITIKDLITYRSRNEKLVKKESEAHLPTKYGDWHIITFSSTVSDEYHVALVKGNITGDEPICVRVHSECLTGDALFSTRCDCGEQLEFAFEYIAKEGAGVILYMKQEGRGIGLINKIHAYHLQDKGRDTVEANIELGFRDDMRDYGIGAQILKDLGLHKIKLMTNNPVKLVGLQGYDLEITERIHIELPPKDANRSYMKTKKDKMGHLLNEV